MNTGQLKIASIVCAVSAAHLVLLSVLSAVASQPERVPRPPVMMASLVTPPPMPTPVEDIRSAPEPVAPAKPEPKPEPKPKPKPKPAPRSEPEPDPAPEPQPPPQPVVTPPSPKSVVEQQSKPSPATEQPAPQAPVTVPPRVDASSEQNEPPEYPRLARRLKEEGEVILKIRILTDGSVADVRVHRSSGYSRLDKAAIKAVRRWRYVPATVGGNAIEYEYLQPIEFRLR